MCIRDRMNYRPDICKFFANNQTCLKGNKCKFLHQIPNQYLGNYQTFQQNVYNKQMYTKKFEPFFNESMNQQQSFDNQNLYKYQNLKNRIHPKLKNTITNSLDQLIKKQKQQQAMKLISTQQMNNEEKLNLQQKVINSMCNYQSYKQAITLLKTNSLEIVNFPKLKNYLEFLTASTYYKRYPWYFLELMFSSRPEILAQVIDILMKNIQFCEAYTIFSRNNLQQLLNEKQKQEINKFITSFQTFQPLTNPLLQHDAFGPSEENLQIAAQNTFARLVDEQRVIIIESDQTEGYAQCIQELKSAEFISFNTKFTPQFNKSDPQSQLCLITMGIFDKVTKNYKAYLLDTLAIKQNNRQNVINDMALILNSNQYKIGMQMNSDIQLIKIYFSEQQLNFNYFVELQTLVKSMYNIQTGLTTEQILTTVLNKKISKMEQMSNWLTRPLRKSQKFQAGMDVIVNLEIIEQMKQKFGNEQVDNNIKEQLISKNSQQPQLLLNQLQINFNQQGNQLKEQGKKDCCLLYTSPSPRDQA
eukprot:TRINITY_DN338_c0_g1_i1.p1 TRINITY_DN338_c0_g1~~TRINITY_DN338_c0_g1_i1.p1  ORF type:complete len:528 (+),score=81.55 TRINITY_DN338_c0_g1_i1:174-1757(+)